MRNFLSNTLNSRSSTVIKLLVAILLVIFALVAQRYLNQVLPGNYFFLFVPAVVLVAWSAGFVLSTVTTALCVAGAYVFFPAYVDGASENVALLAVGVVSLFTGWLVSKLRAATALASQAELLSEGQDRLLDRMFTDAPAYMVIVSYPDLVFLRANKAYEKLVGQKDLVGKKVSQVLPLYEADGLASLVTKVAKSQQVFTGVEVPISISRDGEATLEYFDFIYQPVTDKSGQTTAILGQGTLVTEKVLARKAIENERENFRNLFKQTPEMVCILKGPDHVFEFVNEAHIKVLGFDATGKAVREAQPESVQVHGILDDVYRTGVTAELHEIPVTVGKALRYFNLTYAARRDAAGIIDGIMILGTEITAQVEYRKLLEESQKRYQLLFDNSPLPKWIVDVESLAFVDVNRAAIQHYGYSKEEFLAMKLTEIRPKEDLPEFFDVWKNDFSSGATKYNKLRRHIRKDGSLITVEVSALDVFVEGRKFRIGAMVDMTERLKAEEKQSTLLRELTIAEGQALCAKEEAERERAKFEAAFHAVREGIYIFDSAGNPIFMNDAAAEVFGAEKASDVKRRLEWYYERLELFDMNDRLIPQADWPVSRVLRGENLREWHIKGHRRDTDEWWIWSASGSLAVQAGSQHTLAVVVLRDITEQKRAESELYKAKEEAERANSLKSAFLANMSHEIRTPLGAMIGFADLLRDPSLKPGERDNYTEILARNGESLSVIINDILDLSKVEAGQLSLEFKDVNPREVAEDVVSLLRVKAKEKALSFDFACEASAPETIVSDAIRMRQVLLNIVGNAIKFTHYGSVKVRCFGCKNEIGRNAVCFEVTDTGIGIPEAQKEKVFEMFVQADGSITRRFGGTGLGLALSRRLALSLGGDLKITDTQPGRGTTFLITFEDLPEKRNSTIGPERPKKRVIEVKPNALAGIQILVVDDSPDNRQLIWHYLSKQGAVVDTAENGLIGYRLAIAGNYDIVLMDIQMPEMDGYTATHKLREAGFRKPIIALTAHAMTDVRQKCLNVGCTTHLPKPIDSQALVGTIIEYTT